MEKKIEKRFNYDPNAFKCSFYKDEINPKYDNIPLNEKETELKENVKKLIYLKDNTDSGEELRNKIKKLNYDLTNISIKFEQINKELDGFYKITKDYDLNLGKNIQSELVKVLL